MNNEISNALIASYPDAINFKETESYKSFYDALKRFLCVDSFEKRDVFLHDKQAEESYLFDFKQDDKQRPMYFQRSYARTNDVSVVTSNRYTNVRVVDSYYYIHVTEEVNGSILDVYFKQDPGCSMCATVYMIPAAALVRERENCPHCVHPGFYVSGRTNIYTELISYECLWKALSEEEMTQFVGKLSSMTIGDIYNFATNYKIDAHDRYKKLLQKSDKPISSLKM